jgi:hypothetical protein
VEQTFELLLGPRPFSVAKNLAFFGRSQINSECVILAKGPLAITHLFVVAAATMLDVPTSDVVVS